MERIKTQQQPKFQPTIEPRERSGRECPFCHVHAQPRGKTWHLPTCPMWSCVATAAVRIIES